MLYTQNNQTLLEQKISPVLTEKRPSKKLFAHFYQSASAHIHCTIYHRQFITTLLIIIYTTIHGHCPLIYME